MSPTTGAASRSTSSIQRSMALSLSMTALLALGTAIPAAAQLGTQNCDGARSMGMGTPRLVEEEHAS